MGADQFTTYVSKEEYPVIAEAFLSAVRDAAYWHGHDGYTGTVAEKGDYLVAPKLPDGMSVDLAIKAISEAMYSNDDDDAARSTLRAAWGTTTLRMIVEAYDDKWGPAVAIDAGDHWVFCGWASA